MNTSFQKKRGGFTLIEIMVAISIFMIIMLATVDIMIIVLRTQQAVNRIQALQDNARFSLELITKEMRTAVGYDVPTFPICAAIAGVIGFYVLADKPTIIRVAALVGGLVVAVGLAWTSTQGRDFLHFAREAVRETKKVVWPTRKEAMQITAIVFGFVLVMALFLWGTDKALEVLLYDFILGWKN